MSSLTSKIFGDKVAPTETKNDLFAKRAAVPKKQQEDDSKKAEKSTAAESLPTDGDRVDQSAANRFDSKKLFQAAPPAQRETRRQKAARELAEKMEAAKHGGPVEMKKAKKHLSHSKDDHKEEDKRTIFIGNLPNAIDRKQIEKHFKKCGIIENVRVRCQQLEDLKEGQKTRGRAVRILRGEVKKDDTSSAIGYVLFKDAEAVAKACELSGTVLGGRHLSVTTEDNDGKAFMPRNSLFLGNLAYDVADEEVWQFFIKGGFQPSNIRIIRDKETNQAKGFGYVSFGPKVDIEGALKLRDDEEGIRGRQVRITHVQKSKALNVAPSRREKRQKEMKTLPVSGPAGRGGKKGRDPRKQEQRKTRSSDDRPAWMGTATNPRKKLARDLRPLVEPPQSKDRRARKGPHPQMKKQTAPPKK